MKSDKNVIAFPSSESENKKYFYINPIPLGQFFHLFFNLKNQGAKISS